MTTESWMAVVAFETGNYDADRAVFVRHDGTVTRLPPRENRLLSFLIENQHRFLSRQELLREVWEVAENTRTQTVEVTLHRLRGRIERDPAEPVHLRNVAGQGYRFYPGQPTQTSDWTSFGDGVFGRAKVESSLRAILDEHRLVTLVGPGGVGKTTYARSIAAQGDTLWVDAAPISTLEGLTHQMATALSVGGAVDLATAVEEHLAYQGPTRVIIDNVEQLLPAFRDVLNRWIELSSCRWVCTSRIPTGAGAEAVFTLGPLDVADAKSLFMERARRVVPQYAVTEAEQVALDALMQRLGGLPLAIELAASRVRLFGPQQLLERLDEGVGVLRSSEPGVPERQKSLERTLEWSWSLLSPEGQKCIGRFVVFRGGFPLSVLEVASDMSDPEAGLEELLRHSWVQGGGGKRFSILEPVREFVLSRLDEKDREVARTLHARWCAARIGSDTYDRLHQRDSVVLRSRLVPELLNFEAALEFGTADERVRCAAALQHLDERHHRPDSAALLVGRKLWQQAEPDTRLFWGLAIVEVGPVCSLEEAEQVAMSLEDPLHQGRILRSALCRFLAVGPTTRQALFDRLGQLETPTAGHDAVLQEWVLGTAFDLPLEARMEHLNDASRQAMACEDGVCMKHLSFYKRFVKLSWLDACFDYNDRPLLRMVDEFEVQALMYAGRWEEAISLATSELQNTQRPGSRNALFMDWSECLIRMGKPVEALEVLDRVAKIRLDGGPYWGIRALASVSAKTPDAGMALEQAERAYVQAAGRWGRLLMGALVSEAWARLGHRERALELLEHVKQLSLEADARPTSGAWIRIGWAQAALHL